MKSLLKAVIRECENQSCRFRFPDTNTTDKSIFCPKCNSAATTREIIDLSRDFRDDTKPNLSVDIITILDNIRGVYNTGSIFRTAVGFGFERMVLCGITPSPNHRNFGKTSMGAEDFIRWDTSNNCLESCRQQKQSGFMILAAEKTSNSINLCDFNEKIDQAKKIAVVIGNELTGVDPRVLSISDMVFSIPIFGENKSYNVATAFGIIAYHLFSLFTN